MSDRTPDLEELRTTYGWASSVSERYPRMEAFDRAISKVKADAWQEGWEAGAGWPQDDTNPHKAES